MRVLGIYDPTEFKNMILNIIKVTELCKVYPFWWTQIEIQTISLLLVGNINL